MEDVNYYTMLKKTMRDRGVTLQQLSEGLCSVSNLALILSGERQTSYQLRNRLMARLGIEPEEFEDYVQYDEYLIWKKSVSLIQAVRDKNAEVSERIIAEIRDNINNEDIITKQFLYDVEAKLGKIKGVASDDIYELQKKAVYLTMPQIDYLNIKNYKLAPVEYYLLIRLILQESEKNESEIDGIIKKIVSLIDGILHVGFGDISMSKILPYAVVSYGKIIEKNEITNLYKELYGYTDKAIESLRKAGRLYYLKELLDLREYIRFNSGLSSDYRKIFDEVKFSQYLKEIYDFCGLNYSMDMDCYIYRGAEVYNLSEIVRKRRNALGLTQADLAEGICDLKTIRRLESGKYKTQRYVIMKVLERIHLYSDYRIAEITTNDIKLESAFIQCKSDINKKNYDEAEKTIKEIEQNIDMACSNNRQAVGRLKLLIKFNKNEISRENMYIKLENLLEETVNVENLTTYESYYTKNEIQCFHQLARCFNYEVESKKYCEMIEILLNKYGTKNEKSVFIKLFEVMLGSYSNYLSNKGRYQESNSGFNVILENDLRVFRGKTIATILYSMIWNEAKESDDLLNKKYEDILDKCILFSMFFYNKNLLDYIVKVRKVLKNKDDWTSVL